MTKGFVLIFNKKETENGYPYINVYNLVDVEIDKEEWDDDPYIVLSRSYYEVPIGSWEEDCEYQRQVGMKIDRMELKGKFLHKNEEGLFEIYDADKKEFIALENNQDVIEHNFTELLCSQFVKFP